MPTKAQEGDRLYVGRRADMAVINCTVDREAERLLRQYAGGKKLGTFVSRLVHTYHERQRQGQQIREAIQEAIEVVLTEDKA